ncbi:Cof subfamily protein (haloacid dehalogenase superfamily) [Metabacillus crassostreae]|uniref:HAD family hydrolase n=1 Tax=Metabacillus crassostreae TaxID=929098 RepID=UPI00195D16BC|nr:HAD family hydrolase [Metabacillus crassostreae]MBM7603776.1 Cof subfamily protein (haloacid dehalogenase superfamily) [Metabacillus crassostreae]
MKNYQLLFLDIDGTILKPDDTIEESTKEAIGVAKSKGITVFLATGRPLHEISTIANELNITSLIGYNGAYAIHNGKDIFKTPMNKSTVEDFVKIANDNDHEFVLYTHDKNVFSNIEASLVKEFIQAFHLHKNNGFSEEFLSQILGITLINLKENEHKLYETKEPSIHLSQVNVDGLRHCYDVIRDNVNKGIAVQHILDLLNINKENAVAFGDGMNDKEMLSIVGEGFAMGNAHPDLIQYAKHQTTSVSDSGIYNGLKKIGVIS